MKNDYNFFDVFEEMLQDVSDDSLTKLVAMFLQRIPHADAIDHLHCIRAAVEQEAQYRGLAPNK